MSLFLLQLPLGCNQTSSFTKKRKSAKLQWNDGRKSHHSQHKNVVNQSICLIYVGNGGNRRKNVFLSSSSKSLNRNFWSSAESGHHATFTNKMSHFSLECSFVIILRFDSFWTKTTIIIVIVRKVKEQFLKIFCLMINITNITNIQSWYIGYVFCKHFKPH